MASRHLTIAVVAFGLGTGLAAGFFSSRGSLSPQAPEPVFIPAGTAAEPVPPIAEPEIPPQTENALRLVFVGDLMFDRRVAERSRAAGSLAYPLQNVLTATSGPFHGPDLLVGNLEGPLTSKRRPPVKEIDFAFDPAIAGVLKDAGFDAVSQANNHALDQGREGAEESRRLLRAAGIAAFGDQVRDDEASAVAILERGGKKIALVGFNVTDNPLDDRDVAGVLKAVGAVADVVIVFMHWGEEYRAVPDASQTRLARLFVDEGADAVIGAHPHWMQSVGSYKGVPIVSSLGNFVFDQDWSAETNEGLVAELVVTDRVTELRLHPVRIVRSRPALLTGGDRQKRLDRLAGLSDPALSGEIRGGVVRF